MASFVLSLFPLDVLDVIWDLIESVSEGFLTYSWLCLNFLNPLLSSGIYAFSILSKVVFTIPQAMY